jgi:prophage tail gpP-like protein
VTEVSLRVNRQEFTGWKSARVVRGIESVAGSFELTLAAPAGDIPRGAECSVLLGREVVLTGYVDRREVELSAGEHNVTVGGRDRTGDLVDCSAELTRWEVRNTSVLALAALVAQPHGVGVTLQPGLEAPPKVAYLAVDPGDSAFEVIERACRAAALLPVADGRGGLVLTRAGSAPAAASVVEGRNMLSGRVTDDCTGQFRRYVVRGQQAGSDSLFGAEASSVQASAEDAGAPRRSRVLVVRAESGVTRALARRRAEWEAAVRAARAVTATVTVQGWAQRAGSLWPVNALVHVESPTLGLGEQMLITQAAYRLDSSGTTTELTLRRADAFRPEPVVPERPRSRGRGKSLEAMGL